MAALVYAGPGAVITGPAALRRFGLRAPRADAVDVLVAARRRRQSTGFVTVHRTTRFPSLACVRDGIQFALAPAGSRGHGPRSYRPVRGSRGGGRRCSAAPMHAGSAHRGTRQRASARLGAASRGADRGGRGNQVHGRGRPPGPHHVGATALADVQRPAVCRRGADRSGGRVVASRAAASRAAVSQPGGSQPAGRQSVGQAGQPPRGPGSAVGAAWLSGPALGSADSLPPASVGRVVPGAWREPAVQLPG
jgi:hypothetical protein